MLYKKEYICEDLIKSLPPGEKVQVSDTEIPRFILNSGKHKTSYFVRLKDEIGKWTYLKLGEHPAMPPEAARELAEEHISLETYKDRKKDIQLEELKQEMALLEAKLRVTEAKLLTAQTDNSKEEELQLANMMIKDLRLQVQTNGVLISRFENEIKALKMDEGKKLPKSLIKTILNFTHPDKQPEGSSEKRLEAAKTVTQQLTELL